VGQIEEALALNSDDFKANYGRELGGKKEQQLIFHCSSGGKAERAAQFALALGYELCGFQHWFLRELIYWFFLDFQGQKLQGQLDGVGKGRGIVGAQEKFNKKFGMNSFHRKIRVFNYFSFFRFEFQSAKQNFMEFLWNVRQISIQNGGNWKWRFLWNPKSLGVKTYGYVYQRQVYNTFFLIQTHKEYETNTYKKDLCKMCLCIL
jgi:rhodanese-related sulfurtransferase